MGKRAVRRLRHVVEQKIQLVPRGARIVEPVDAPEARPVREQDGDADARGVRRAAVGDERLRACRVAVRLGAPADDLLRDGEDVGERGVGRGVERARRGQGVGGEDGEGWGVELEEGLRAGAELPAGRRSGMRLDSRLRACVRACGRHAPVRCALCETLFHSIDLVVCEGLGMGGRGEHPAEEEEEEGESREAGCSAPHAENVQHAILRGAHLVPVYGDAVIPTDFVASQSLDSFHA